MLDKDSPTEQHVPVFLSVCLPSSIQPQRTQTNSAKDDFSSNKAKTPEGDDMAGVLPGVIVLT